MIDEAAFLEQALRYLEGKLGAEETLAFHRALETDPARARRLAALAMQRVQLFESGKGARVLQAIPRRRRATRTVVLSAAAAAAVVAIGAARFWRPPEQPADERVSVIDRRAPAVAPAPVPTLPEELPAEATAIGRIEAVQGEVAIVGEGVRASASVGRSLSTGETLTVGGDRSRATLRLEDGRLELAAGTSVEPVSAVALSMVRGRLHAAWSPRQGAPPAVTTPLGEVRATSAARFRIDVRPDETRVEIHQGAVRVTAFSTGKTVDLEPGALAILLPERDAQIEREEPPLPIVFDLQADPRELPIIRRAPDKLLKVLRGWPVDREGLLGPNKEGFQCAGQQRHALFNLSVGAVLGNRAFIDEGWRVIDSTMRFQAADGSFLDSAVCDADWLGELSHELLILMESEWERPYRARIKALVPRLARTAAYLAAPARLEELRRDGAELSKAYFLHGAAFALAGLLLDDPHLQALGREHIEPGLQLQRGDGAFLVHNGTESTYQAYILHHLFWIALRFPSPRYDAAIRLGGAWLMGRITAAGELDATGNTRTGPNCIPGKCLGMAWERVIWGLIYYGDRDPRALAIAPRVRHRMSLITR